jgi:hypothetical protein
MIVEHDLEAEYRELAVDLAPSRKGGLAAR